MDALKSALTAYVESEFARSLAWRRLTTAPRKTKTLKETYQQADQEYLRSIRTLYLLEQECGVDPAGASDDRRYELQSLLREHYEAAQRDGSDAQYTEWLHKQLLETYYTGD